MCTFAEAQVKAMLICAEVDWRLDQASACTTRPCVIAIRTGRAGPLIDRVLVTVLGGAER